MSLIRLIPSSVLIDISFITITFVFIELGYLARLCVNDINNIKTKKIKRKEGVFLNLFLTGIAYSINETILQKITWKIYLILAMFVGVWKIELVTILVLKPWVILKKLFPNSKISSVMEIISEEGQSVKNDDNNKNSEKNENK